MLLHQGNKNGRDNMNINSAYKGFLLWGCMLMGFLCMCPPHVAAAGPQAAAVAVETVTETVEIVPAKIAQTKQAGTDMVKSSDKGQEPAPRAVSKPVEPQKFHQLEVFSWGGIIVLLCLWVGLAAGPVWFLLFTFCMCKWGWLTIPLWIQELPIKKLILYFILLKIIVYIAGLLVDYFMKDEEGDGAVVKGCIKLFSTDLILIIPVLWVVINGVFTQTPGLGREVVFVLSLCCTMGWRIAVRFGSLCATLVGACFAQGLGAVVAVMRILCAFISLWIISIWL